MRYFEDDMHQLARLFMSQFPHLKMMSLDDFLFEYNDQLTDEQNELGHHLLDMFNYVK
jgi:hypothetical protein